MAPEIWYPIRFFRLKNERPGGIGAADLVIFALPEVSPPDHLRNTISPDTIMIDSIPSWESTGWPRLDLRRLFGCPGLVGSRRYRFCHRPRLFCRLGGGGGGPSPKGHAKKGPWIPAHRPSGPHIQSLIATEGRISNCPRPPQGPHVHGLAATISVSAITTERRAAQEFGGLASI